MDATEAVTRVLVTATDNYRRQLRGHQALTEQGDVKGADGKGGSKAERRCQKLGPLDVQVTTSKWMDVLVTVRWELSS